MIPDVQPDAAGAVKCPHCGWTFRPAAQASRAAAAPVAEEAEEAPGYDVVDDDPPVADRPTPRRPKPKKKRRGGKPDKQPTGLLRHLPLLAIIGGTALVAGVVITLVLALRGGGGGPGGDLGRT